MRKEISEPQILNQKNPASTTKWVKPTPDCRAFQKPGQLRRRNGSTPIRTVFCPPTPHASHSMRKVVSPSQNLQKATNSASSSVLTPNMQSASNMYIEEESTLELISSRKKDKPERIKSQISKLAYVAPIGEGNFATVSVVRNIDSGRLYALKENKRYVEKQSASFAQHTRTALLWASLGEHENVVEMVVAWIDSGYVKAQMQLCLGGNLIQYADFCTQMNGKMNMLNAKKNETAISWDIRQIWRCLGDAATGLAHIHSKGYCHNDIKPGNLFVGGNSLSSQRILVGDFGNARQHGEMMDGEEGDFKYLSKEVLADGISRFSSDIFSLGIAFYEVVADVILPEVDMWHTLREGRIPPFSNRFGNKADDGCQLYALLCHMMHPAPDLRPAATSVLEHPMIAKHRSEPLNPVDLFSWIGEDSVISNCLDGAQTCKAIRVGTPMGEKGGRDVLFSRLSSTQNYADLEDVKPDDNDILIEAANPLHESIDGTDLASPSFAEHVEKDTPRRDLFSDFEEMRQ